MSETRETKLLAWIEPAADGTFKAVIVQTRLGSSPSSALFTAEGCRTFAEARDWVEGQSIVLGREIRWMSSP